MARVVQRRNNPPYLLILFVFLFLIATVVAVLMYLKNDELNQSLAEVKGKLDKVGSTSDVATATAEMAQAGAKGTALLFYRSEMSTWKESILPAKPDEIRPEWNRMVAAEPRIQDMGLIPWIKHLNIDRDAKDKEIGSLNEALVAANRQTMDAKNALDDMAAEIEKIGKDRQDEAEAIQQTIATLSSDDQAKWEKLEERLGLQLATARKQADQARADWEKVNREKLELQKQIQSLIAAKQESAALSSLDPSTITNQPDGKIMRVLNDKVFIDLGKSDKVQPAMTFSIYPAGPTTDESKLKGTLEILQVGETTSECRIINRYTAAGTITVGDIIGNIAFVRNQTFRFVVRGQFDMMGSGRSTSDAAVIRDMIARNGGKLMDDVSVATDFLVLGESPETPEKPGDDATEDEIDRYIQQMKVVADYDKARNEAMKYGIPILNANRFMALIGYQPGKTELPTLLTKEN